MTFFRTIVAPRMSECKADAGCAPLLINKRLDRRSMTNFERKKKNGALDALRGHRTRILAGIFGDIGSCFGGAPGYAWGQLSILRRKLHFDVPPVFIPASAEAGSLAPLPGLSSARISSGTYFWRLHGRALLRSNAPLQP